MNEVYVQGTTVRLECTFKDFGDIEVDPEVVKLIIYDYKYNKVEEFINIVRDEVGKYHFDYITPNQSWKMYYEWYAEISGKPSIKRGSFTTKFMV